MGIRGLMSLLLWLVYFSSTSPAWAVNVRALDFYRPTDRIYQSWGSGHTSDGSFHMIVRGSSGSLPITWIVREKTTTSSFTETDQYELSPGKDALPYRSYVDQYDQIFVSGFARDASGVKHSILRRKSQGVWTTVDDFNVAPGVDTTGYKIISRGDLVAYAGYSAAPVSRSFVRLSEDRGNTWRTVFLESYPQSDISGGYCVLLTAQNEIFVLGIGETTAGGETSYVHRSRDLGATWDMVDANPDTGDFSCLETRSGVLYVAGSAKSPVDPNVGNWHVRYSVDSGLTWADADNTNRSGNTWAYIHGLGEDSLGNVYSAIPHGDDDEAKTLIRYSPGPGQPWVDYAEYSGTDGRDQAAMKGFSMWADRMYISGYEYTLGPVYHVGAFLIEVPTLAAPATR